MESETGLVLVVDDNPVNLKIIAAVLEEMGHECILASSAGEAKTAIEADPPDLILLDVMMPGMDGYEFCTLLRATPGFEAIPVIFLSARGDTEDIVRGFDAGGSDYVLKPFRKEVLRMRIQTQVRLRHAQMRAERSARELRTANEELLKAYDVIRVKNKAMEELNRELEHLSLTDALTGLFNRRYGMKRVEEEYSRVTRYGGTFSLLMGDLDLFKRINDEYGHDAGDEVLKSFAKLLQRHMRKQDAAIRWGGEEFMVILPDTGSDGAHALGERIRTSIALQEHAFADRKEKVTATFGVSTYLGESSSAILIRRADMALLEGKQAGRNRTVAYASPPVPHETGMGNLFSGKGINPLDETPSSPVK